MLVGMLRAKTAYNPIINPDTATSRRSRSCTSFGGPLSRILCRSRGEMLGVPIRLEIGVDLAVGHEHAGRPFGNPGLERVEIGKSSHRRGAGAVAAGNGGKIRVRELDDIDRVALAPKLMHFGRIGAVVVDKNAEAKLEAKRGLEIGDGHHEAAVACAEHGKLARISHRQADRGSKTESHRLE